MQYAKVVLGLPIDLAFDYLVPRDIQGTIEPGVRVEVSFRNKKMIGYVTGLTQHTNIKNIKPLLRVIDEKPVLDKNMLLLTKQVSEHYCCSWGEAIETSLPAALRKGRLLPKLGNNLTFTKEEASQDREIMLVHDLTVLERWNIYIEYIKKTLAEGRKVLILLPDVESLKRAQKILKENISSSMGIIYRHKPEELEEWAKIRKNEYDIVIGIRSGIFAPLTKLGLIIIDEEEDSLFKQEQVPHYHARDLAFMRSELVDAKLILGSSSPSLETFYLSKIKKIKYVLIPRKEGTLEIKIIDMRHLSYAEKKSKIIFSKLLQDAVYSVLNTKGKILLFLNRKGFATLAFCHNCTRPLKCGRCSVNLVYHFEEKLLKCHHCNFKMTAPEICPNCNAGYIKFSGFGTEKIESELSRLFPQARIKKIDSKDSIALGEGDIFVATESVIGKMEYNFDLIGVLSIDNSLSRIDFRASEKTFYLLSGLSKLAKKSIIIQTSLPLSHCFRALQFQNPEIFYLDELKQRKQLNLPPFKHLGLIKLRGKNEEKVKEESNNLFGIFNKAKKAGNLKIVSLYPGEPHRLRSNYYWQILVKAPKVITLNKFIKNNLKDFSRSGIIVTVDIDPI